MDLVFHNSAKEGECMNCRNILLIGSVLLFSSLFSSMEEIKIKGTQDTQTMQMDYQLITQSPLSKKKFKLCRSYECCPRPYEDASCNISREAMSRGSVPHALGYIIGECIAPCIISCFGGGSYCQACKLLYECSPVYLLHGLTALSIAGVLCPWTPCLDQNGLNCCKKVKDNNQLNGDLIELDAKQK